MTSNASATNTGLTVEGHVTSGMHEGRGFISKDGYLHQFVNRLGYEPFYGTLNIEVNGEDGPDRSMLEEYEPTLIEEWSDGERTYGAVLCYPAVISDRDGDETEPCHIIVPKRTDHDREVLEVIAPKELRTTLDVSDGDAVELHLRQP